LGLGEGKGKKKSREFFRARRPQIVSQGKAGFTLRIEKRSLAKGEKERKKKGGENASCLTFLLDKLGGKGEVSARLNHPKN